MGRRRNKPITGSSVVSQARISVTCRTCGRRRDVDPTRAISLANQQDTMLYCDPRCNHLNPFVAGPGTRPCDCCGETSPTVELKSELTLCLRCGNEAHRTCLQKPRFADAATADANAPRRTADVVLQTYPCPICLGVHVTSKQGAQRPEQTERANRMGDAYRRLGLDVETDRHVSQTTAPPDVSAAFKHSETA